MYTYMQKDFSEGRTGAWLGSHLIAHGQMAPTQYIDCCSHCSHIESTLYNELIVPIINDKLTSLEDTLAETVAHSPTLSPWQEMHTFWNFEKNHGYKIVLQNVEQDNNGLEQK